MLNTMATNNTAGSSSSSADEDDDIDGDVHDGLTQNSVEFDADPLEGFAKTGGYDNLEGR